MRRLAALGMTIFYMLSGVAFGADAGKAKTKDEIEIERRAELDNSEWPITMTPRDGKGSPLKDKLIFKDGKVSIKGFEKDGYGPTSFSLVIHEEQDRGVWETYQAGKKGGLSVRGDWKESSMSGIVSENIDNGKKVTTWAFYSQEKIPVEKPDPAAAASGPQGALTEANASAGKIGTVLVSKEKAAS